jgi:hypothetical protein
MYPLGIGHEPSPMFLGNPSRHGLPPVSVTQQHCKVRPWRQGLAAANLFKTDAKGVVLLLRLLLLLPSAQVLRRLAETGGDYEAAAAMADFQSGKPALAKAINVAKAKQDEATATALCRQLDALSLLSYNPFDPDAQPPDGSIAMGVLAMGNVHTRVVAAKAEPVVEKGHLQ